MILYADRAMESNMLIQGSMLSALAFIAASAWTIECLLMEAFVAWVAAIAFVTKTGFSLKLDQKQKAV